MEISPGLLPRRRVCRNQNVGQHSFCADAERILDEQVVAARRGIELAKELRTGGHPAKPIAERVVHEIANTVAVLIPEGICRERDRVAGSWATSHARTGAPVCRDGMIRMRLRRDEDVAVAGSVSSRGPRETSS